MTLPLASPIVRQENDVNDFIKSRLLGRASVASSAMVGRAFSLHRCHVGCRGLANAIAIGFAASIALGVANSAFSATPASSEAALGLAPESNGFRLAAERERDAETLQTLTAEGRL